MLFSCADSVYNLLSKIIQDPINDIAPTNDICVKGNTKPWFASNMIELIKKKDKLKKKFLYTKLHVDYEYFKEQRINIEKAKLNKRKQIVLRNNCRNILTIRKNFGKHLKTWVCHAKFLMSQRFVSDKITCYSSVKIKNPIPSMIFTAT